MAETHSSVTIANFFKYKKWRLIIFGLIRKPSILLLYIHNFCALRRSDSFTLSLYNILLQAKQSTVPQKNKSLLLNNQNTVRWSSVEGLDDKPFRVKFYWPF